eukprot:g3341.t1
MLSLSLLRSKQRQVRKQQLVQMDLKCAWPSGSSLPNWERFALLVGYSQPPQPQGPVDIPKGKPSNVDFQNPFMESVEFSIQVDNPSFQVTQKTFKLDGKKSAPIAVSFVGDRVQQGRLLVTASEVPVPWVIFLQGHVFCRGCVEQCLVAESSLDSEEKSSSSSAVGHCPTCRAEMHLADLHPHQALRSLLDELPVSCPRGCGWTGRRDALKAHQAPGPGQCIRMRLEAAQAEIAFLSEAGHHLRDRDQRIAQLEARVAEQDQQVVDFGRQLLAKEVRIQDLERQLEEQERDLTQRLGKQSQV